jgi:YbbR domain-containing protein|uniref:YbbR-like domain-containing protein n=1 Tax=candidate division CPR3 bacterium TaxID=2268181 RepID=A0A7V3JAN8_UNCC3
MRFFTTNVGVKLFALVCATLLWMYVSAGENKVDYFPGNLSIEAKNSPEGLAPIYDEQKVRVKLQAPYEIWSRLNVDNLHAFVDLAGLSEGTHDVEVKIESDLPNVSVIEKEPSRIIIRLEPVLTKKVPVKVRYEGEAKAGFVPGEAVVSPSEVEAKGAKSLIDSLSEATALVKLSGEDKDFKKVVFLAFYNDKGEQQKGIEFNPKSVTVDIPIETASETKTVGVKPKIKGRPKADYFISKIETDPATVEISGSETELKSILYIETKEIDVSDLATDLEKEVDLMIPQGIISKTKYVNLKITLAPNMVEREVVAGFSYVNRGQNLTVSSVTPNTVRVVLICPSAIAGGLSANNVVIALDLQNKVAGSYLINITKNMLSVPDGCAISSWLPSAVTVVLQ